MCKFEVRRAYWDMIKIIHYHSVIVLLVLQVVLVVLCSNLVTQSICFYSFENLRRDGTSSRLSRRTRCLGRGYTTVCKQRLSCKTGVLPILQVKRYTSNLNPSTFRQGSQDALLQFVMVSARRALNTYLRLRLSRSPTEPNPISSADEGSGTGSRTGTEVTVKLTACPLDKPEYLPSLNTSA